MTASDDHVKNDKVTAATRNWLEKAVIGLNLCPFARAVYAADRIRYVVSDATTIEALLEVLAAELEVLGKFSHPRIVRLLHACEDTGDAAHPCALAFELLEGGSLADWLRGPGGEAAPRGALTPLQRVDAALGIAHGLKYLHGLREAGEEGAPRARGAAWRTPERPRPC